MALTKSSSIDVSRLKLAVRYMGFLSVATIIYDEMSTEPSNLDYNTIMKTITYLLILGITIVATISIGLAQEPTESPELDSKLYEFHFQKGKEYKGKNIMTTGTEPSLGSIS